MLAPKVHRRGFDMEWVYTNSVCFSAELWKLIPLLFLLSPLQNSVVLRHLRGLVFRLLAKMLSSTARGLLLDCSFCPDSASGCKLIKTIDLVASLIAEKYQLYEEVPK